MSWPEVALGDVCEFKYGKSLAKPKRSGGPVRVYGSNGVVGAHDSAITDGPTIIIGRKGSFGEVHYSEEGCWPIDTTYFVDESVTRADLRWLQPRLRCLDLKALNRAAAVPGLNREDAYRQTLSLPPLVEQRRIAAILDQADTLRTKRRESIARMEGLSASVFSDLFGDLAANDRNWAQPGTLGDFAEIVGGITKGRKPNGKSARAIPYLAVSNVKDGRLDLTSVKTIDATEAEIDRYKLEVGDLLLTEGGDPDKLGRGTIWAGELQESIHQNHIFRARLTDESLTPLFARWLLSSPAGKRFFLRSAKQTTGIASINKPQLSSFPMLVPPIDLQRKFGLHIKRTELAKTAQLTHLAELDALFASLQHRAFSGER